jgi:ATP-dependent helicase YprA (DUF1998 family)
MLPEAALAALELLQQCECVDSCYRCLRNYRNQSEHALLDKRLVIETLQNLAAELVTLPVQSQVSVQTEMK